MGRGGELRCLPVGAKWVKLVICVQLDFFSSGLHYAAHWMGRVQLCIRTYAFS